MIEVTKIVATPAEAFADPHSAARGLFAGRLATADGHSMPALPVPVVAGEEAGGQVEIRSGLKAGDRVVVSGSRYGGYAQFRVEEYKKPEFEVTVEPGKDHARLGEKITAKIKETPIRTGRIPSTIEALLWAVNRFRRIASNQGINQNIRSGHIGHSRHNAGPRS